jgi:hypothetical protein
MATTALDRVEHKGDQAQDDADPENSPSADNRAQDAR